VFAGREGFWKYEVGNEELEIPRRELFGANVLELVWSSLRRVGLDVVAYATEVFARGFVSLVVDAVSLFCRGNRSAVRVAISNAMILANAL
jgi:hypothetical protein